MARKKLIRSPSALRGRRIFSDADRKTDLLYTILRNAALKHQTEQPQIFYSLREVATRYLVSTSMVSEAYHRLEKEGLLARVRSSRTILKAASSVSRVVVHGIVGVPMPLSLLITRPKCRIFLMLMRSELSRRAFRAPGLLFTAAEARADFLLERLKESGVSAVLWYLPDQCARETALLLKDIGVRVIGIGDGGVPTIPCRYQIQRETAMRVILRRWKTETNFKKIGIVRASRRSAADEERLEAWLESEGFSCDYVTIEKERTPDAFLKSLSRRRRQGFILPGPAASFFGFRAPESLCDLFRQHRVALMDGPVSLPFAPVSGVRADIAAADWASIASAITEDFLTRNAFADSQTTVFEAKAYMHAPLSQFAQAI
jgi:hypothetical protein